MAELLLEVAADGLFLLLIAVTLFFSFGRYLRHRVPAWLAPLEQHRLRVLFALVALLVAIGVSEEVVDGESGMFDEAVLRWLRAVFPVAWIGAATVVTDTGSMTVLLPASAVLSALLLVARRARDAALLAVSMLWGALIVYIVKHAVGRTRPELWDTEWYWGSSFPSGHTLSTAVFATSLALIARRLWPASRPYAVTLAALWIFAVALSRLILGVHWPTDVLAAAAIGSVLPLLVAGLTRTLRLRSGDRLSRRDQ